MIEQRNEAARRRIVEVNKNHAVTYRHLSKLIGVHFVSMCNWKRGDFNFTEEKLSKLERALEKYERLDD